MNSIAKLINRNILVPTIPKISLMRTENCTEGRSQTAEHPLNEYLRGISITLNASFDQVEQLKAVSTYDGAEIFEEISEKGA